MTGALGRAVDVRKGEMAALVWSCAYFFLVLTAYYILRPIRDEMGVQGGVENLAWLFTGTLVGMLLLHPLYTSLVGRMPRTRFVPFTYRFFILNLVAFFLLFRFSEAAHAVWIGRVFFIWVSVFNLFVVSVFWSFMTDLYRPSQSKRLFGIVAVGGTLGAMLGSSITSALAEPLGPINLLLVSALFLEIAARAAMALDREEGALTAAALAEPDQDEDADRGAPATSLPAEPRAGEPRESETRTAERQGSKVIGGDALEGIRNVMRSPYLLGIAALMLFFTISATFLYFQQAALTDVFFGEDSARRTRFFANIDLIVNALTLVAQVFLTGRMLRWLGVGMSLAFLPLVSVIGFGVLAVAPILGVLVVLQVLRRAGNYAIQRPAREVLYTVMSRTDKYKAKNFNDTFVYRVGDQVGAWSYTFVSWLGMGIAGLSFLMVPFSAVWLVLALWLGTRYRKIQAEGRVAADAPRAARATTPS
ncbi:MAG TPA: MFS transporter [Longimicrobiaceae bacterium]